MAKQVLWITGLFLLMISSTHAADIPSLNPQAFPPYYMAKLGGALLLVLLLFVSFTWVMRKFNRFQTKQNGMKVIHGMNIGAKEKLIVVEVNGRQLLLGVTPSSINKLMDIDSQDSSQSDSFGASLRKAQDEV